MSFSLFWSHLVLFCRKQCIDERPLLAGSSPSLGTTFTLFHSLVHFTHYIPRRNPQHLAQADRRLGLVSASVFSASLQNSNYRWQTETWQSLKLCCPVLPLPLGAVALGPKPSRQEPQCPSQPSPPHPHPNSKTSP